MHTGSHRLNIETGRYNKAQNYVPPELTVHKLSYEQN